MSTTRTSRTSAPSSSSAKRRLPPCATCRSRSTAAPAAIAEERGLILADTKFEFGYDDAGVLTLADEVLTSDSSRDTGMPRPGAPARRPPNGWRASTSRSSADWLAAHWDKQGEPPALPDDIVTRTRARYAELLERLTS